VFAALGAVCFLIAWGLHWAGRGTSPWDPQGFLLLGLLCTALHLVIMELTDRPPWRWRR
jgi:hypothetical protein